MRLRTELLCVAILAAVTLAGCSSSDPRKWNKRERGTAIGGASGAVLGAIVGSQSDNTAAGAVIGGAAGAGAGALLGREFDKK